jgi:Flp pilus assembly pilin Flp
MLMTIGKLTNSLRRLRKNESGAVTVDWVALTAGIIVVGLAIVWFIMDEGVDVLAGKIVDGLVAVDPGTTTGSPPVIGDTASGG